MRPWSSVLAAGICCLLLAPSTSDAATIYGCKKKIGGALRVVKATKTCASTETKISWDNGEQAVALQADVATLKTQIAELQELLQHFSRNGNDIAITGANLQITSGSGATDGAINGLGNLIVGYNELRGSGDDRTGSHNIIVGSRHNYSKYGGLVVGLWNTISAQYATVSGGSSNVADGDYSSVSGGGGNAANGDYSSVSGGGSNTASFHSSSVSGGAYNNANGQNAAISGGSSNAANGIYSSVSGGASNAANGQSATVSGGSGRSAPGINDWVAGTYSQDF